MILSKISIQSFLTVILFGIGSFSHVGAEPSANDARATDLNKESSDAQKNRDLLKMKDQSSVVYFEQTSSLKLLLGGSGLFVNPGTGLGVQTMSFLGGLEFTSRIRELELGGYLHFTGYGASSTFKRDTLIIPFGVVANYFPLQSFYFGARTGIAIETLSSYSELRYTLGPQVGCDFRVAEAVSLGAEFALPVMIGGPTSYFLMMTTGHLRFWL